MRYLDADANEVRESEWINIGVDTGAGKTAWPQSVTYGKRVPGDVHLTFLHSHRGECQVEVEQTTVRSRLRRLGSQSLRGVQAPVCKPLLSVGEFTTMGGVTVLYADNGYLFHKGSNVAKKIDAWIQKEISSSHTV